MQTDEIMLHREKMKAKFDEWDAEAQRLMAQARQRSAEGKLRATKSLDDLEEKREGFRRKLDEMKGATQATWDKVKKETEHAWDATKSAWNTFRTELKDESATSAKS